MVCKELQNQAEVFDVFPSEKQKICEASAKLLSQLEIRCSIRLSYGRKCRSESIQAALNRNRHV